MVMVVPFYQGRRIGTHAFSGNQPTTSEKKTKDEKRSYSKLERLPSSDALKSRNLSRSILNYFASQMIIQGGKTGRSGLN
jgi:hypothetical protein